MSLRIILVQAFTAIYGLMFTFLAVHALEPALFGELRYVLVLLPILMLSTLPSYDVLILRESSIGAQININLIFKNRVYVALVGVVIISAALNFNIIDFGEKTTIALVLCALLLPFYETTTGFKNYLIGRGLKDEALKILIRNRLYSLLLLIIGAFFLFLIGPTVYGFLVLFMVCQTLPNLFTHLFFRKRSKLRPSVRVSNSISFKEALITSLAMGIGILSYSIDKLLVQREMGSESLAFYTILILVPLIFAQLIDAVIPYIYRQLFSTKVSFFCRRNYFYIFGASFLFAAVYGIFSSYAYPYIFGEFYNYELSLSMLAGMLAATGSVEFFFIQYLYKNKKANLIVVYSVMSLIIIYSCLSLVLEYEKLELVISILGLKQLFLPLVFYFFIKQGAPNIPLGRGQ